MSDQRPDLELMQLVRSGDLTPLGSLFERHHARIFNFCLRMTGSRAVAEDLVQEVFLRVMKYRESFRGDREFLPWLYSIARNVCYDHGKKASAAAVDPLAAEPLDPGESARDRLERDEQRGLLHRALLDLPIERREVLILSRFELRNYAEIATLLGCSVGAVKVRVHRALKQLRACYVNRLEEVSP